MSAIKKANLLKNKPIKNMHSVGSFNWITLELKRIGVWRANIISVKADNESIQFIGVVVVEVPNTSLIKIDLIKREIMPAGFHVLFKKMNKPLSKRKYTYNNTHIESASFKKLISNLENKS